MGFLRNDLPTIYIHYTYNEMNSNSLVMRIELNNQYIESITKMEKKRNHFDLFNIKLYAIEIITLTIHHSAITIIMFQLSTQYFQTFLL